MIDIKEAAEKIKGFRAEIPEYKPAKALTDTDRLTWRDIYDGAYAQDIIQQDYDTATVFTGGAIDRLAAYEDTGLTPEQIEKMITLGDINFDIGENAFLKLLDIAFKQKYGMTLTETEKMIKEKLREAQA